MRQARTFSRWTRGLRASFQREAASPGRRIGRQVGELAAGELRMLGMNTACSYLVPVHFEPGGTAYLRRKQRMVGSARFRAA